MNDKINEKKNASEFVNARIDNLLDCEKSLENVKKNFENDPQDILLEPTILMTTKTYRTKIAQPVINVLKN